MHMHKMLNLLLCVFLLCILPMYANIVSYPIHMLQIQEHTKTINSLNRTLNLLAPLAFEPCPLIGQPYETRKQFADQISHVN